MAFTAKVYVPGATDSRMAERLPLDLSATLRDPAALAHDATVHDLSATGCLIETAATIPIGTHVSIGIGGIGRVAAEVVRHDGERLGCAFATPIDPALAGAGNVVSLNMQPLGQPAMPAADDRWSPRTRLAIVAGGSIVSWAMVIGVARLI